MPQLLKLGRTLFLELANILIVVERSGIALVMRRFRGEESVISWYIRVGQLSHLAKIVIAAWRVGM